MPLLTPLHPLNDQLARFFRVALFDDLTHLPGLQILVVLEEVLDLLERDQRRGEGTGESWLKRREG